MHVVNQSLQVMRKLSVSVISLLIDYYYHLYGQNRYCVNVIILYTDLKYVIIMSFLHCTLLLEINQTKFLRLKFDQNYN